MFRLRNGELAEKILERISALKLQLTLMHVCGTHQETLVRFGLIEKLEMCGIDVRQGPGCPVCVTLPQEIDEILALAKAGKTIAIFGDALKVPGSNSSLILERSGGADIRVVYGIDDAVRIARKEQEKEVVFFAMGFETTAPTTAAAVLADPPENFSILSTHRIIPPALRAIANMGEIKLHGLIQPGHVSTIIGTHPYRFLSDEYKLPQVVAGFEPIDMLMGIYMLAKQNAEGRSEIENEYKRVVKEEGNPKAIEILKNVFYEKNVAWRGFPVIEKSRLELRENFHTWNAREKYRSIIGDVDCSKYEEPPGCKCGEMLRGVALPEECALFGKKCTPDTPIGPCMVSREGSCNIGFRYRHFSQQSLKISEKL